MEIGDKIQVTWHPMKRGGAATTGTVEHIYTGWNAMYGKETTTVTFRDDGNGQIETALLNLDTVVVISGQRAAGGEPHDQGALTEAEPMTPSSGRSSPSVTDLAKDADSSSLRSRFGTLAETLRGTFHALAAHGSFQVGGLKLQDPDLNRIHAIVGQIDGWRMFYEWKDDEYPPGIMDRLGKVREAIQSKIEGVWADPSAERLVQQIRDELADFDTRVRRLGELPNSHHHPCFEMFAAELIDMRLRVWTVVAYLKKKVGGAIQPKHLPADIANTIERGDWP
jgi:hypothetical protein